MEKDVIDAEFRVVSEPPKPIKRKWWQGWYYDWRYLIAPLIVGLGGVLRACGHH